MSHFKLFIGIIGLSTILSCKKDQNNKEGKYVGAPVSMGNGLISAFVEVDNYAKPKTLGFSLSASSLENLPDLNHVQDTLHKMTEFELQIPIEGFRTPFKHIVINWNPIGHMPPPYSFPHFDMHFYTMSSAERALIKDYKTDILKFENKPNLNYLPAHYIKAPEGEPKMGCHWIDTLSSELLPAPNAKQFTETFVYGTYDGKVNFYEPMITYSFLKSITEFSRNIPWPDKVQISGYYPRILHIIKSGSDYTVTLESWKYRTAE